MFMIRQWEVDRRIKKKSFQPIKIFNFWAPTFNFLDNVCWSSIAVNFFFLLSDGEIEMKIIRYQRIILVLIYPY